MIKTTSKVITKYIQALKDDVTNADEYTEKELEKLLKHLSDSYYNKGISLLSDEIFDYLKEKLHKLNPKNKFLVQVGAPVNSKEIVKLPFPMGSLNKIKGDSPDEIDKWINKYNGPYVVSDKLDGVSAQLYKNTSGQFKLYTRGDGIEGQDITHLIKYIFKEDILDKIPNNYSIRGELILKRKDFNKYKDEFKNARNTIAGLVNAKKFNKTIANDTKFVSYAVLYPRMSMEDQMKELKKFKLDVVKHKILKKLSNNELSEYLIERRKESDYEIDGIVVVDSSRVYEHEEGYPQYAFAFKSILNDQMAETTILDVIWEPSMDGYLKPKVELIPVNLVGVTVKYATAFNAKYVVDNVIGPGAVINIIRSGDVIPHILKVIKQAASGKPKMPNIKYEWNETKVNIYALEKTGETGKIIKAKIADNFFSKLNIKYISLGIISKLVDENYDSIEKILDVILNKPEKLNHIDGIGEKIIEKIATNIKTAFNKMTIYEFMGASHLFGEGVGTRKIKIVLDKYPTLMNEINDLSKKELKNQIMLVEGYSDITADKFVDNIDDFMKFYSRINKIIDISHLLKIKKVETKGNDFDNMTIVFTGFRDKELEKFITDRGGKIGSSVSGKTSLLIYADGEELSAKLEKARELEIKTITKSSFIKKYKL